MSERMRREMTAATDAVTLKACIQYAPLFGSDIFPIVLLPSTLLTLTHLINRYCQRGRPVLPPLRLNQYSIV
jgi:hypothetical protein